MPERIYDNRELSWLKFNERVLEEAQDSRVPLLERLNFASIFQSNLDEFFMVRVGSLYDQMLVNPDKKDNKSKMTAKEQLSAIFDKVNELEPMKDIAYKNIMLELREYGIEQVTFRTASISDQQFLEAYFKKEIKPLIAPLIIDKKTPFPFLKNKEIYCVLQIQSKSNIKLGIIPASGQFSRIIPLEGGKRFILAEELILHFAPNVFKNYKIIDKTLIRITRNADITVEEGLFDHDLDFREVMEELCKKRKKLQPVRLQLSETFSQPALEFLCKKLALDEEHIFYLKTPLDLSFAGTISDMCDNPQLKYDKLLPQKSSSIAETMNIIPQIKRRDILLSYPYESIKPFIQLLNEAANDPKVTDIKITLYRLAKNSQIVAALCDAAENGKNVLVLVELRARFDEENNIGWSRRLQDSGCTIIYGPRDLKVHSKLLLITRQTPNGSEYITQIGTGNYNEKTSTLYTDLSLLTANQDIGTDAESLFDALVNNRLVEHSEHLLIAPLCLRDPILSMIDEEIEHARNGEPAYVGAKINSLCDKVIIDKLVEASQAGVKVDLVIRGICSLIAGVEGFTENITVTSIVGRYLEHSRIYIFGTEDRARMYISSADYMTRNTIRRVEVAAPIYNERIKKRLWDMFRTLLSDNVKARKQLPDGTYVYKVNDKSPVDAQRFFFEEAYTKAEKKAAAKAKAKVRAAKKKSSSVKKENNKKA
ncbi:polyphosphate kinase 1 [Porcipelethomonas sp.]|uniref:polyphosphate kinase 1 n=1 Tax=Porcipelethomonas sp. TaxID=2981675 RepID=UPI003EF0CF29